MLNENLKKENRGNNLNKIFIKKNKCSCRCSDQYLYFLTSPWHQICKICYFILHYKNFLHNIKNMKIQSNIINKSS